MIYLSANQIKGIKSALGQIIANDIRTLLSQSKRPKLLSGKYFLPVGIEVFDFQQSFSIFRFEDFEFQIEMHSDALIILRVFSRAATNRAISISKSAK